GYFAQELAVMDERERVIDYIKDEADYIRTTTGVITASRMLERFLFSPDMQYAPIAKISGGERRRLYLLRVLMSSPNVLILDEPTNDLDIATLQVLEGFLDTFMGIVIVVSHDRYFLDRSADRIGAFEEGRIRIYEGDYTDYLEKSSVLGTREEGIETAYSGSGFHKKKDSSGKSTGGKDIGEKAAAGKDSGVKGAAGKDNGAGKDSGVEGGSGKGSGADWKKSARAGQPARLRFSFKEQKEFETIDDDIAALEERIAELDQEIEAYSSDFVRLNELMKEKEEAEIRLEEKMDRWVYLNDLAERIEEQRKARS
ncbi:MAG: ABC-F family ATP-binding cassette domain-containing protein, partial [Eubacterium sp.]|nr:ABC-F family ATP-binding cassette domain-containing protein [Eubacterium sp.]